MESNNDSKKEFIESRIKLCFEAKKQLELFDMYIRELYNKVLKLPSYYELN